MDDEKSQKKHDWNSFKEIARKKGAKIKFDTDGDEDEDWIKERKKILKERKHRGRIRLLYLFLLFVLLVTGITVYWGKDKTSDFLNRSIKQENTGKNELLFNIVESGGMAGNIVAKKEMVIINNEKWQEIWQEIHAYNPLMPNLDIDENNLGIPSLPYVDFNKEMIVVATAGRKNGGYNIRVDKMVNEENRIVCYVINMAPNKECMATTMNKDIFLSFISPYCIVKIKKTDKPIVFNILTQEVICK